MRVPKTFDGLSEDTGLVTCETFLFLPEQLFCDVSLLNLGLKLAEISPILLFSQCQGICQNKKIKNLHQLTGLLQLMQNT